MVNLNKIELYGKEIKTESCYTYFFHDDFKVRPLPEGYSLIGEVVKIEDYKGVLKLIMKRQSPQPKEEKMPLRKYYLLFYSQSKDEIYNRI